MWSVAFRGAIFYILALNLVALALKLALQGEINRELYVWVGVLGTMLVMISLGYLPIKYLLRSVNQLKTWLYMHMVFGGIGAFLILVHSELHLRSLLPAATLFLMELVAFTGILGRYLFVHTATKLHQEAVINKSEGLEMVTGDYVLLALTTKTLRTWRWIHVQLSWLLLMLTVFHVITEFLWRGLRL